MFATTITAILLASNIFLAEHTDVVNDRAMMAQEKAQEREERAEAREDSRMEHMEEREEAKQERMEEREDRREEFREQLAEIKDARKARILENLQSRFTNLQNRWGEHWYSALSRLSEILVKIEERGGTTAEVTAAKTAIATATTAVDEFLTSEYFIEIDTEDNVGQNVRTLLAEYKADAREVFGTVKDAKDAVREAAQAAAPDETKVDEEEEETEITDDTVEVENNEE